MWFKKSTKETAQLHELIAMFAALSKAQALIEYEMDGTIITANENFLNALGYALDEIKGKHHGMLLDAAKRSTEEYRQFWLSLKRGEHLQSQGKKIAGKNGKEVWLEASYDPIFDNDGKPYKVIEFAIDITHRKQATLKVADKVRELVTILSSSAAELQTTAQTLAAAAEQTNRQSVAVATASEELTASVAEISKQLTEATRVISKAVSETGKSEQMVSELTLAAEKIGNVSGIVAQIAGQTNLLALNATIEAARAGDAGKGFAVVASEVKSLANQTAKATDEIGQQVQGIQSSSQATATAINLIAEIIGKVNEITISISGAVEEQSAATHEVAQNISGVHRASEETGQSASNLLTVSSDIAVRAAELEKEFTDFVASI